MNQGGIFIDSNYQVMLIKVARDNLPSVTMFSSRVTTAMR